MKKVIFSIAILSLAYCNPKPSEEAASVSDSTKVDSVVVVDTAKVSVDTVKFTKSDTVK